MLEVFICEDDKEQLENLSNMIQSVITIDNLDMSVTGLYTTPYDLLNDIQGRDTVGLYFLDVDLNTEMNGIKLAEKIRDYDPRGFIVFVTTHAEMSYLTFRYKVEALDYVIKDEFSNLQKRVHDCVKNAYDKYSITGREVQRIFSVTSGDKTLHIELNKILFFETASTIHKVKIHGDDFQFEFYGQMKEVMEKLDERFFRCHRSYVVNTHYIDYVDHKKRTIYMKNGEECMVSVRGLKTLKNDLLQE